MKSNCCKMQDMRTETLKEAPKYLHRRYVPPSGATGGLKSFSEFSELEIFDIFRSYWSL
jgi:hypothetical protein